MVEKKRARDAPMRLSTALINRDAEVGRRPPLAGTVGMEGAGDAMASIRGQAEALLASLEGLYPNNPEVPQLRQLLSSVLSGPADLPYGPEVEEEGLSAAALSRPSLGMSASLGAPAEMPPAPMDAGPGAGLPPELLALLGQDGVGGPPPMPMGMPPGVLMGMPPMEMPPRGMPFMGIPPMGAPGGMPPTGGLGGLPSGPPGGLGGSPLAGIPPELLLALLGQLGGGGGSAMPMPMRLGA